jgi:hypothetical protein
MDTEHGCVFCSNAAPGSGTCPRCGRSASQVSAPAGWYDDPSAGSSSQVRYFDGVKWTDHVAPKQQPAHPAGLDWVLPVSQSRAALWAGYLGLFSLLFWPLGPFAIWASVSTVKGERTSASWLRIVTGFLGGTLGTVVSLWFAYILSSS